MTKQAKQIRTHELVRRPIDLSVYKATVRTLFSLAECSAILTDAGQPYARITVQNWSSGRSRPPVAAMVILADAFAKNSRAKAIEAKYFRNPTSLLRDMYAVDEDLWLEPTWKTLRADRRRK